jgi:hypothetical protein
MINNQWFVAGEIKKLSLAGKEVTVHCRVIRENSVEVSIDKNPERQVLYLLPKAGSASKPRLPMSNMRTGTDYAVP